VENGATVAMEAATTVVVWWQ